MSKAAIKTRHQHWKIAHPFSIWTEDYRLWIAANEREARASYRADKNIKRLPAGTLFYPAEAE